MCATKYSTLLFLFISIFVLCNFRIILCYSTTKTQKGNSVFVYAGQARSERDLQTCSKNAISSIVHKRFWHTMQVERFCRCEEEDDYALKWSESIPDNYTMPLDNRSQLKFCDPVGTLPNCLTNRTMLSVQYYMNETDVQISSSASCFCPPHTMWKLHQHLYNDFANGTIVSTYLYRCSELEKCDVDKYCGDIRTDHMSTYYHCSCPNGHICVHTNKQEIYKASKPFYEGPAYKGYCIKTSFQ